ncbi:hypothetical protein BpsS140_00068 [Bacillus phage vB_BpsS-140]|nr:hypothetical protein BpsS140_00068 [Bacillus phage vB_BpsS-140]
MIDSDDNSMSAHDRERIIQGQYKHDPYLKKKYVVFIIVVEIVKFAFVLFYPLLYPLAMIGYVAHKKREGNDND